MTGPSGGRNTPCGKPRQAVERCRTISTLQKLLGGKWKIEILYYIAVSDIHRFGQLRRQLGEITESSLTKQLRELERDGFLHREVYGEVPPRVEYSLTELGRSFAPVLDLMLQWSAEHLCPPDYVNPYGEANAPDGDPFRET